MRLNYFGGTEGLDPSASDKDVATMVERALRPLAASVGLNDEALAQAVDRALSRRVAKAAFDGLEAEGIQLTAASVLDLGAGLGHASVEAVMRGCELTAVEPGVEWCSIVRERLKQAGSGQAIVADGERLPFSDSRFDIIVSIGVLEHVRGPKAYLSEAYRVLKPGGWMFLSCENYLSFYEPHYQLAWLPLFPKKLASVYLRLRGRSSEFLTTSIYYTTRLGVMRWLRSLGFRFPRESSLRGKLHKHFRLGYKWKTAEGDSSHKAIATSAMARILFEFEIARAMLTPYVSVIVQKPPL
jgi:ubiquinone/menaquinone biosynthesis C-methylase UbiE